ncbi:heparan-sulfate 6-O-sulfotransferase 3 [Microcaecilia unicolor]|uniref:Heparan-sulfate 6-O-sulfotransferase n=1 Tax=Microcaecilia unicolor TaxID=1415580 RepID=A0A6P7Y5E7_9AMPH|nr:heparan-sulfate 6-O-sulfotransferase 3 [Microcaecilia unicolor]
MNVDIWLIGRQEDHLLTFQFGVKVVDLMCQLNRISYIAKDELDLMVHVATNGIRKCGMEVLYAKYRLFSRKFKPRTSKVRVKTSKNFYYITMLRDPVSRYLSEWKHVQRGATWKASLHVCDGRSPTPDELPTCYLGDDWSGVSLREFMDCGYNLANNRQVRMLADLSLVGCYNLTFMNESERNEILLMSAKNNLKNMAFFGLTEFQRKTQYLFEKTFNLKFISPFTQFNTTRASNVDIDEWARKHIEELNYLDMQLYEYAKDLFLQRFQYTRQQEHHKKRQKRREERRLLREHRVHPGHQGEDTSELTATEDYNSQVAKW